MKKTYSIINNKFSTEKNHLKLIKHFQTDEFDNEKCEVECLAGNSKYLNVQHTIFNLNKKRYSRFLSYNKNLHSKILNKIIRFC